ncbi:MAG: phosphoribosyl-ATP diphosphatase [Ponticaulis sp.]|nr:phosphoribosyl-ATP diphosphatase [Ponticaulis sp.]|tara:strand:- start:1820 stop:2182 length:363 start_codon:yes stop_codon:yes gene_type:complete
MSDNSDDKPAERVAQALNALASTIDARAAEGDASSSYTAKLLAKGPHKTAKKLGEEAVELAIALTSEEDTAVTAEAADVLFHLLVALKSRNVSLDAVAEELISRQGLSGLVEKANRPVED